MTLSQHIDEYSEEVFSDVSSSEIQKVEVFDLSIQETESLKQLKEQYHGIISSNLSPLEWLGIFADSEQQRRHYARQLANTQLSVMNAISQFEAAYADAIEEIVQSNQVSSKFNKHMLLITRNSCNEDLICQNYLTKSLEHLQRGGSLDIFVKGTTSNSELRFWAIVHQIPMEKILSRAVTINHADHHKLNLSNGVYFPN